MKKNINFLIKLLKKHYVLILSILALVPIYFILYKFYIPRINAFGCFDDCNNFMRGYFVLSGKELFLQVFSGHQPLGSYISALIQFFTSPQNIFELVLRHRQFIILFGFLFNALLILRFGTKVLLFVILFEFSKFYLFGDRFLGENMFVYPLLYLIGLVILKFRKQKIYFLDYILTAVFCWFIIFMRKPDIPVTLFLFLLILWDNSKLRSVGISVILFSVLSLITVFIHDINAYFFNVITFNLEINVGADAGSTGMPGPKIMQMFFYPIYVVLFSKPNIFSSLLIGINLVFLLYFIKLLKDKAYKFAILIFIVLGLANIRVIVPGTIFYYAFHMSVWYGIIIFIISQLMIDVVKNKIIVFTSLAVLGFVFISFIISPKYFAWEEIDQHSEFIANYGTILQEGEVIKILSKPTDSLFLDASDDLIYWQSKRFSHYKYSWYTSSMPSFKVFSEERINMFKTDPPDFYREYGFCPKKEKQESTSLPKFIEDEYIRLESDGKQTCIFVRKEKLKEITKEQWDEVATWHFNLPENQLN